MSTTPYVMMPSRGLVLIGGADRTDFLQGLISNDIRRATLDHAIWAALLTPQGKYLHDFFVVEIDGQYFLDCESERLMDLGSRLSKYKLRAQIDLGIGEDYAVAVLPGTAALDRAGLPADPGAARSLESGGIVYVDPRHSEAGARAILPKDGAEAALQSLGFEAGTPDDYDRVRLPLGLPDGSRDLVVEKSILLESNFDELNGVDWDKGCYMGQELTARTKYRGLIKKRMMPVDVDGPLPAAGTEILLGDKNAGEMRSGSDGRGIALLRLEQAEKALNGEGQLVAGEATLMPRKPDWATF
jgi:folate-binding protein YgfZ